MRSNLPYEVNLELQEAHFWSSYFLRHPYIPFSEVHQSHQEFIYLIDKTLYTNINESGKTANVNLILFLPAC